MDFNGLKKFSQLYLTEESTKLLMENFKQKKLELLKAGYSMETIFIDSIAATGGKVTQATANEAVKSNEEIALDTLIEIINKNSAAREFLLCFRLAKTGMTYIGTFDNEDSARKGLQRIMAESREKYLYVVIRLTFCLDSSRLNVEKLFIGYNGKVTSNAMEAVAVVDGSRTGRT